MSEVPTLPVPVFDVPRVFRVRDRLMTDVLDDLVGAVAVGGVFQRLVEELHRALDVSELAVADSARYLLGTELTQVGLRSLAWRLAGNIGTLRTGIGCPPWTRQLRDEWVPVQVAATRYAIKKRPTDKYGKSGRAMRFTFLAGTPCATQVTRWWSNEKINLVADSIGFKFGGKLFKADQSEFQSLRFVVLVEAVKSAREPDFFHVACPGAFLEYNRVIIRQRRRIRFDCPEGYEHECHVCPVGARTCSAACHAEDYREGECAGCGRVWWFDTDPKFVNDFCIHCQPLATAGVPLKKLG